MSWKRRRFWKMTGSGNDFVFFDARSESPGVLETPSATTAICDRRRGVGADGIVFVEKDPRLAFGIRYLNRDGSLAELCGNASLCAVSLARTLGIVSGREDFEFGTTSGPITGRLLSDGPEIDSAGVADAEVDFKTPLAPGEARIGFARVGVPHLVVLCEDVEMVNVSNRGRHLRQLAALSQGANANFVSRHGDRSWAMRTYERGVEDETLACGTGAVATAALLGRWGLDGTSVAIVTRSGASLRVQFRSGGGTAHPSLQGEGRLLFEGVLGDIPSLPD